MNKKLTILILLFFSFFLLSSCNSKEIDSLNTSVNAKAVNPPTQGDSLKFFVTPLSQSYSVYGSANVEAMDNIGFEAVYGLYWTYDDLKNADGPWRIFKSNNQLMIEIKEKIIDELIKWRNKNVLQHRI